MAKKKQQIAPENGFPDSEADHKSEGRAHKEPSEREVFTADDEFYEFMARQGRVEGISERAVEGRSKSCLVAGWFKHLSALQKTLALSILGVVTILLYALLKLPSQLPADTQATAIRQQAPPSESMPEDLTPVEPQKAQGFESASFPPQPLSLKVAQEFYLQKDYRRAYEVYNQLRQNLPTGDRDQLLRDFLQLKMALCMRGAGDFDLAGHLFRTVSQSRSPIIKVLANYYMGFMEVQKKQYLKARTRAYRALALIDAVDFDQEVALSLQRDCHLLAAESLTRYILSLCDSDQDLPGRLWSGPKEVDPFSALKEASALDRLLNSGSEQLSKGLLAPRIQKNRSAGAPPCWSVTCYGPSIEELLARFATNAGVDICWVMAKQPAAKEAKDAVRSRSVHLYLPAANTEQVITVAAGSAGLLGRLKEKGIATIFDPDGYCSLSEYISLLSQEAISLWQKFLLSFYRDQRVPHAHFALGLLQGLKGGAAQAIAEYKLVANRYPHTNLAPFALLQSSKLKSSLHDYPGARQDLKQLVEQYPDSELSGWACLHLADTTRKAGITYEAARLYRKVYHLGLSEQAKSASALGAAKCFYEMEEYEAAAKWFVRYIGLAPSSEAPNSELYLAYYLLGKSYLALGNIQQACDAFQYALSSKLSKDQYVEAVSALVNAQIQQEHLIEALTQVDNLQSWQLPQEESVQISLLKSRILRTMGLVDKAIAVLGDRAEYIASPQLKAKISFELAKCYIAKGDLELARKSLTDILALAEPGPLVQEVALELADVCMKLGEDSQAISVCTPILNSDCSAQLKQKALDILTTAYKRQKNYDRAAMALLGKWDRTESPHEERTSNRPPVIGKSQGRTR